MTDDKDLYGFFDTGAPVSQEAYTLEEILAEYGAEENPRLLEDALPAEPVPPPEEEPPPAESPPGPREEAPEVPPPSVPGQEETDPVPLEAVVGSTVRAVMEETEEEEERRSPFPAPKRGLFSRRKLVDTEELYDRTAPPPPKPDPEPIGPEPELSDAADKSWDRARAGSAPLLLALITALPPTGLALAERYGASLPMWSGDLRFQAIVVLACLAATAVLCRAVFARALEMLRRRRCVGELLISLAVLASAWDCAEYIASGTRAAAPPYGGAACLALVFAQWGVSRERRGMYDAFRAAALDDEPPYLITDTDRGACKQRGSVPGFYTIAVRTDGAALLQTAILPVVLVGSVVFAALSSWGQGRGGDFALNWSAILTAGASFSLPLCWALPWSDLARRLQRSGSAVAGWSGAEKLSRRRAMILTDADLFPPGTVQLAGERLYGEERRRAYIYAATMAKAAGSGLQRLFGGLMRGEGGRYEEAAEFSFFEDGGWSAVIRGESVLMGTGSFLRQMGVRLPGDVNLKTGIFLSIDRRLAAVFAVKYNPSENVDYALRMMKRGRVTPILASRDPNITPELIRRKFYKGVRVEYPDLTERIALSEAGRDRDLPRALLFREGLLPYAEAVVGSGRLCRAVRRSAALSLLGSASGTLLSFYLVFQGAYDLLTPLALTAFLLLWTAPVLLLSDWTCRY